MHMEQLDVSFIHMWEQACTYRLYTSKIYEECFLCLRDFVVSSCVIKHSWQTRHILHELTCHKHTYIPLTIKHMWHTTQISSLQMHILP